ncbi:MAG: hypothetical protein Kow0031_11430 [Anaerolineae bacterium]
MMAQSNSRIAKEAILEKIETSYADLVRLYRTAPVAWLVEPVMSNGWSVKDIVAHLAAWEWRCAALLEQSEISNTPLQAEPDVDALNQETFEERKNWGWEEVDDDARAAHRALLKAIKKMPPDRLNDPVVYNAIAVETWDHYAEHLPAVQAWHSTLPTVQKRSR